MLDDNAATAIGNAFIWNKTLEGHSWWDELYRDFVLAHGFKILPLTHDFDWQRNREVLLKAGALLKAEKDARLVYAGYRLTAMGNGDFDGGREEFLREELGLCTGTTA